MLPAACFAAAFDGVVLFADVTCVLWCSISQCASLQHLFLDLAELDTVTQPLESYAAFTASAQLTELHLRPDGEVQPLRPGALQHMFPAGMRVGWEGGEHANIRGW